MRVIAGVHKGRRLKTPVGNDTRSAGGRPGGDRPDNRRSGGGRAGSGDDRAGDGRADNRRSTGLRPTSARVKEALFSILSPRLPGARVADLYAGTGALGLESLSRGAARAVLVEQHAASLRILRDNVARCGCRGQCVIRAQDVDTFLTSPPARGEPAEFDIVFADPPYHTTDTARLLSRLGRRGTLAPHGVVVLEHFHKHAAPREAGPLTQTRQARYGDTMLTFFQRTIDVAAREATGDTRQSTDTRTLPNTRHTTAAYATTPGAEAAPCD